MWSSAVHDLLFLLRDEALAQEKRIKQLDMRCDKLESRCRASGSAAVARTCPLSSATRSRPCSDSETSQEGEGEQQDVAHRIRRAQRRAARSRSPGPLWKPLDVLSPAAAPPEMPLQRFGPFLAASAPVCSPPILTEMPQSSGYPAALAPACSPPDPAAMQGPWPMPGRTGIVAMENLLSSLQ